MLDSLSQFIRSYQWYEVAVEMAVIWLVVYAVYRFLRGTRGAGMIKGFGLVVVLALPLLALLSWTDAFSRLKFIFSYSIVGMLILLTVVFQPELRQAMIRLGHARWFRSTQREMDPVIDAISEAAEFLSKSQFGALIAIERSVRLGGLVEGGQVIDGVLSARLLESIFWPNSPLHDLGVVVRGDRIVAANVQFPLAEEGVVPHRYGSRHRAAAGLSLEADCIVVIVSEETGNLNIAERGRIQTNIPRDKFRAVLTERLQATPPNEKTPADADAPVSAKAAAE